MEVASKIGRREDAFSELLDKVDDFIYDYDGEETELTYIKKHPEKFVFDGFIGHMNSASQLEQGPAK